MGLIVCPLSADYETNNTVSSYPVKPLLQSTFLVDGVLFTPLTVLFKLYLTLNRLSILAGMVIPTTADATL